MAAPLAPGSASPPPPPLVPLHPPPSVEGTIARPSTTGATSPGGTLVDRSRVTESISSSNLQTLNEPVWTTVMRDMRRVGTKLRHVLVPAGTQSDTLKELRDWDLWGPLLLCLVLSIVMSLSATQGQTSLVFASVFVMVWAGAAVVTINAKLLGGNISFFQSVCVLGYCIFPLVCASVACWAWSNGLFRTLVVGIAFVWSSRASVVFMSELVPETRRALAVYPVVLFYIVISWMVYMQ